MIGNYSVYVRDKDGTILSMVDEYTSLRILDSLNEAGSWVVSGMSVDVCPFSEGNGVLILRNGEYCFSGFVDTIEDTHDLVSGLYSWRVQGIGDLGLLSKRICYVDPATGRTDQNSYYTDTGVLSEVVETLIRKNIGTGAMTTRKDPIVANGSGSVGPSVSVKLRFQNLLDAVTAICTANGYNIRPRWNGSSQKIYFEVFQGSDNSQEVVYSDSLSNITQSEHIAYIPEGNFILSGGKGELTDREFATAEDAASIAKWGRIEKYQDGRNQDDLEAYAADVLAQSTADTDGYNCSASNIDPAPQYLEDYQVGDYVGLMVFGQYITAQVRQVEINVAEGIDQISPKFGTVLKGKFNDIFRQISNLKMDVDELLGSEIA